MIDVYILCFNEEQLLPFVIEHYKKYLPNANIIFYDNMSTDNSEKIILNSGHKIRKYNTNNTLDDRMYLHIKNNCWKENSSNKWVLIADMDELPHITEDQLKEEEVNGTSILSFEGYTLIGGLIGCDLYGLKTGIRDGGYDKSHVFNRQLIKEINYHIGAHSANPTGKIVYSKNKYKTIHYKWISLEYIKNRHKIYSQRMSPLNKANGWGVQYYWTDEKLTEVYNSLLPHLINVL